MFPGPSIKRISNGSLADSVFGCHALKSDPGRVSPVPNLPNFFLLKFSVPMLDSMRSYSLFHGILIVVVSVAKKVMGWINTLSIIALVENAVRIIKSSMMNQPRNSMRKLGGILFRPPQLSVPTIEGGGPNPAPPQLFIVPWNRSGFLDFGPESNEVIFCHSASLNIANKFD